MRGDGGASKLLERVRRRVGEELSMPPRRCEEHYRHELKYLISYGQKADLNLRLAPLLEQDSHARGGCYMIRSLYFDDYWNTAYQEKVDGVLMRKKYRIRIYDYSDRVIKLERKRKSDSWIYKEGRAAHARAVRPDTGRRRRIHGTQRRAVVPGILCGIHEQCAAAAGDRRLRA